MSAMPIGKFLRRKSLLRNHRIVHSPAMSGQVEAAMEVDGDVQSAKTTAQTESVAAVEGDGKNRFGVLKFNAAALWAWDLVVENCAICRNHIMDNCIECMSLPDAPECTVAWGMCNHAFHLHCISRWLRTRQVCPLDNQEWDFQRYGR